MNNALFTIFWFMNGYQFGSDKFECEVDRMALGTNSNMKDVPLWLR